MRAFGGAFVASARDDQALPSVLAPAPHPNPLPIVKNDGERERAHPRVKWAVLGLGGNTITSCLRTALQGRRSMAGTSPAMSSRRSDVTGIRSSYLHTRTSTK